MTQKEFLDSLTWIEGIPPSGFVSGDYESDQFEERPMVCIKADGIAFVVGDCNFLRGVCDDCTAFSRDEVVRYAYLWSE